MNCTDEQNGFNSLHRGGAISQSVEQWSRNPVSRVRNQGDALVPFGKALILITRSLGEDLKPSAVWLLTHKNLYFLSSQVKYPPPPPPLCPVLSRVLPPRGAAISAIARD